MRIENAGLKRAARGSLQMQDGPRKTQKSRQKSPSGHHPTTLSGYIFATKACIDNRKISLLSSNISSTCPHNMVNFGSLAAEIVSLVWGTPGSFNGFRILAALLYGTLVVGVSQIAAFNRGRHLYSAGRPSGWAFAHILVYYLRSPYVIGQTIIFSCCGLFFFFFFFFSPRLISAVGDWMFTILWRMVWP